MREHMSFQGFQARRDEGDNDAKNDARKERYEPAGARRGSIRRSIAGCGRTFVLRHKKSSEGKDFIPLMA
jgi:hypothetical protein